MGADEHNLLRAGLKADVGGGHGAHLNFRAGRGVRQWMLDGATAR